MMGAGPDDSHTLPVPAGDASAPGRVSGIPWGVAGIERRAERRRSSRGAQAARGQKGRFGFRTAGKRERVSDDAVRSQSHRARWA